MLCVFALKLKKCITLYLNIYLKNDKTFKTLFAQY